MPRMDINQVLNGAKDGQQAASASQGHPSSPEVQKNGHQLPRDHSVQNPAPHPDYHSEAGSPHYSASPQVSEHSHPYTSLNPSGPGNDPMYSGDPLAMHTHHRMQVPVYAHNMYPPGHSYPGHMSPYPVHHGQQEEHHSHKLVVPPAQVKNQICGTCSKGFARRSDLARHERIHSGVRPHKCEYEGCNKQFIQRSALTVHARVHTGEKPHRCETCGKPFSDSSSLARHRRIHSGKRPYKCPYADCQKTFTRRTTLTRHQSHHTGTLEEAENNTRELLAGRNLGPGSRMNRTPQSPTPGYESHPSSGNSTPSPLTRTESISPGAEHTNSYRGHPTPPVGYYHMQSMPHGQSITSHPSHLLPQNVQTMTPQATPSGTPIMARNQPNMHPGHPTHWSGSRGNDGWINQS